MKSVHYHSSRRKIRQIFSLGSLLLMVMLWPSCDKDHMFDFLKSTGKDVTISRDVGSHFTGIMLEDNIDLVLNQGPDWSLKLEGGENILPGITTEIADSVLTIRNTNKFNWVRSYDRKIKAYVTAPYFLNIGYKGTGTVTNNDTLRQDSLFVIAYSGSGYINLCINVQISHFSLNTGSADFNISGYSGSNFIYAGNYGPFHCLNLMTNNTYMKNDGSNDCYISAKKQFQYEISGIGNIYYSGHPEHISGTDAGKGKAIPLD